MELETSANAHPKLRWTGTDDDGKPTVFYSEPYAGFWLKAAVGVIRVLPIESLL